MTIHATPPSSDTSERGGRSGKYIVAQRCRDLGNAVVPRRCIPRYGCNRAGRLLRAGVKGTRRTTVVQSGTLEPPVCMQRKWKWVSLPIRTVVGLDARRISANELRAYGRTPWRMALRNFLIKVRASLYKKKEICCIDLYICVLPSFEYTIKY